MMYILACLSGVLFINSLFLIIEEEKKIFKKRVVLFRLKPIHVCSCKALQSSYHVELTFKYANLQRCAQMVLIID